MSEVIVRMQMPKGCYECPMYDFAVYRGKPMLCCNANFVLKSIPNNGNPRPSWCPIIGVLPDEHGDLIDRDETFHAAQPEDCTDELWAKTTCGRVVLEAKTVIPATERSET